MTAKEVAASALRRGRPVVVATTVPADDRNRIGGYWKVAGLAMLPSIPLAGVLQPSSLRSSVIRVDTALTQSVAGAIAAWRKGRAARPALDPVHEYFLNVLSCADLALVSAPSHAQLASLDSTCNHR